jgi:hypothetical protein
MRFLNIKKVEEEGEVAERAYDCIGIVRHINTNLYFSKDGLI